MRWRDFIVETVIILLLATVLVWVVISVYQHQNVGQATQLSHVVSHSIKFAETFAHSLVSVTLRVKKCIPDTDRSIRNTMFDLAP
jgi:hypothetical protein